LVFPLTVVSALAVWAACGDDDSDNPGGVDAGTDTGAPKDSGNNDPEETEAKDSGPKDTGAPDTGKPPFDAGEPSTIFPDGGEFAEAGIPCVVDGQLEEEPNDTALLANSLARVRCGYAAVPGDAGVDAGENDWLTFTIDPDGGVENFNVNYEGNVKVYVETDGQAPVDITAPGASLGDIRKGQPYYVQVRSANGQSQVWKIILSTF
jgi:hypothetical protein